MAEKGAPPDAKIAALAARQHGVVSIRQLREAGLSDDAVAGRVAQGRLHRVHRGVYAVGHPGLGFEGRCMAAVLTLGDGVVSHRSAAALWRLLPMAPGPIDVSVRSRGGRRRHHGVRVHRPRSLALEGLARCHRIPVTTPARTISDLRRTAPAAELRRAIRQAEALGLAMGTEATGDRTRSELEYLFLRFCRRHRLPMPEVNVPIGGRVADFLWRKQGLIVETDGYRYHRGRAAFEDDRARDLELRTLGFEVLRLSHRQVTEEPQRVAAVLRDVLRDSGRAGPPYSGYGREKRPT
jgi:very-short-patch-repair endonuclease